MNGVLILGIVILIGFVGNIMYKRTKIPESVFLIVTGIIVGPVLHLIDGQFFMDNASFLMNIALIVILLDSGLTINFSRIVKNVPLAFLFTIIVMMTTAALIAAITHLFFGWPWINGIFLGILGSGTELITVSHLIDKLKIGENTKSLLVLESVLNDITLISAITIFLSIVTLQAAETPVLRIVIDKLFISAIIGLFFAMGWIYTFLTHIHNNPLGYVFTLGGAFFLYSFTELTKFNGAIAVITFAICLGNYPSLLTLMKNPSKFEPVEKDIVIVRDMNSQISFIIRTLFFVFLGLVFDFNAIRIEVIIFVIIISIVEILSRYMSARAIAFIKPEFKESVPIITAIVASGFTSVLLTFIALDAGIEIPYLREIVLLLVMITTLWAIIISVLLQNHYKDRQTF